MSFLHTNFKHPILHRDLKSLNLLLAQPVKDENDYVLTKITDFGLARDGMQNEMMTANTGTYHWMAPEVLNAEAYTEKADVYSYGIVLYEIITRKTPYIGLTGAQIASKVVSQQERPDCSYIPDDCNETFIELMKACWDQDPTNRPTFSKVIEVLKSIEL